MQLLAITHRVRLVLHGHLHRQEDRRVGGIRIVGAPASTQPTAAANGTESLSYFVHTVEGRKPVVRSAVMQVPL